MWDLNRVENALYNTEKMKHGWLVLMYGMTCMIWNHQLYMQISIVSFETWKQQINTNSSYKPMQRVTFSALDLNNNNNNK